MSRPPAAWQAAQRDFDYEARIARALNIHPVIAGVMRRRGIDTVEAGRRFLTPHLSALHDPFALIDMPKAAERLAKAIDNRETVLVHGDYDVDGVSSAALMVRFLSKLGADVQYYIPHRLTEQYGLSPAAVQRAAQQGTTLVVSVDCGTADFEAVAEARKLGMDVIVVDHHQPKRELPEANAIINPKRESAEYPERSLAAVGLAFKVASAVCERMDIPQEYLQRAFLDLVALGTVADVVPLVGENRILAHHGLQLLGDTQKAGIKALMQLCSVEGCVTATDVAYRLAPRMNAVGRIGDATEALELLLATDPDESVRIALALENSNRQRRRIQDQIYRDVKRMINEEVDLQADKALVLASENWHVGVVGIVASKVVERWFRPTILMVVDDEQIRGSARSIEGFDITQALEECSNLLLTYGGHQLAAGMSLHADDFEEFRRQLNDLAIQALADVDIEPTLDIDAEILLEEVDDELLEGIDRLEPFGHSNPPPLFLTREVDVLDVRTVGRDDAHLKLYVSQGDRATECIGFGLGHESSWIQRRDLLDICHTPQINEYNGVRSVQLRLEAVRASERGTC